MGIDHELRSRDLVDSLLVLALLQLYLVVDDPQFVRLVLRRVLQCF